MLKKLLLSFIIIIIACASAQAIVNPVKSVIHPVHETLYVPLNYNWDSGRIKVYSRNRAIDTEKWTYVKSIYTYGRIYGMAATDDNLYVGINKAQDSRLLVFSLGEEDGIPSGSYTEHTFPCASTSLSPAEIVVDTVYEKVYVADMGTGYIHIHNLDGTHIGDITAQIAGKTSFGLTLSNEFIFVSNKVSSGEIYCFRRDNNSFVHKIDTSIDPDLVYPTYLKAVYLPGANEERLFVAINNNSSIVDILVFKVSDGSFSFIGKLLTSLDYPPVGYRGFDITPDTKWLILAHSYDNGIAKGTKIYKAIAVNITGTTYYGILNNVFYPDQNYNGLVIAPDQDALVLNHADNRTSKFEDLQFAVLQDEPVEYFKTIPRLISISPLITNYNSGQILTISGEAFIDLPAGGFKAYLKDPYLGWRELKEVTVISPTQATAKAEPVSGYPLVPGIHESKVVNDFGGGVIGDSLNHPLYNPFSLNDQLRINFANITGFTQDVYYSEEGEGTIVSYVSPTIITYSWEAVATAESSRQVSYEAFCVSEDDPGTHTSAPPRVDTSAYISNLKPNTKYRAMLRAYSNSPDVIKDSWPLIDSYTFTPLVPEYYVGAEVIGNSIKVTWSNGKGRAAYEDYVGNPIYTTYEVGRKIETGSSYTVLATIDGASYDASSSNPSENDLRYAYTDPTAQPSVGYIYAVRALNNAFFDQEFKTAHPDIPRNGGWNEVWHSVAVIDITRPTVATVTTPESGSYYNASNIPTLFQGNAADNSGGSGLNKDSTTFYIKKGSASSQYWNGSTWVSTIAWLATTHIATTSNTQTRWTSNVSFPPWEDGTYYAGAKAVDKAGNEFEGSEITFYYDATAPTVTQTNPANGDQALVSLDKITVTFNDDMNSATVLNVNHYKVSGTKSGAHTLSNPQYNSSTKTVTVEVTAFEYSETVTCTVEDNVTDKAGNKLDGDKNGTAGGNYVWTFTIEVAPPGAFDLLYPQNGTIASTKPTLSWEASTNAQSYTVHISGLLDVTGITTTSYQPTTALDPDKTYTWYVTAHNGPKTSDSIQIWSFTTASDPTPGVAPTIEVTYPTHEATDIPTNATIVVTFSEPMDQATVAYSCNPNPGGWDVTWSQDSKAVAFVHSNPFDASVEYEFQITAGKDLGGNTLVVPQTDPVPNPWRFTVGTTSVPPAISLSPTNFEFSMQPGGDLPADKTLTVSNSGGGQFSWSGAITYTDGDGWLSIEPSQGTCPPDTVVAIKTTDAARSLLEGTYRATVTISAPNVDNSPQSVNVTLEVSSIPPEAPTGLMVTSEGENAIITWSAPTSGPAPEKYYVYRGTTTAELQSNISNKSPLAEATGTTYKDLRVLAPGDINSYYYKVTAFANGQESGPSNMGYIYKEQIIPNPTGGNKHWVSIPYFNNYATLADILEEVNGIADITQGPGAVQEPANVDYIARMNPATQNLEYMWYDIGMGQWMSSTDNPDTPDVIEPPPAPVGEGFEITLRQTAGTVTFAGAHDPDFQFNLTYNSSGGNKNWISIPYHKIYTTLADILEDINGIADITQGPGAVQEPANVDYIARMDPATQNLEYMWYDIGMGQWMSSTDNLDTPDVIESPLAPVGEGFEITIKQSVTWKPKVQE